MGPGAAPSHTHPTAAAQQRSEPRSPLIDGINTMNQLERVVALDQAFALTSLAVSMKRIADQLVALNSVQNTTYNLDRINNTLKELGELWTRK